MKLSISHPCTKTTWDKMTPQTQGRYCSLCALHIVDFTSMTDEEIKNYFLCHQGENICGRIQETTSAKTTSFTKISNALRRAIEMHSRPSYFRMALLSGLTLLTVLTGCRKSYYPHPVGKVSVQPFMDTTKLKPMEDVPLK